MTAESRELVFIVDSSFSLTLASFNDGNHPVVWSAENPLHLSYRWRNEVGEVVEREGLRTTIPTPLPPKTEVSATLRGRTPEEPGNYQLQISLVLEGVHWACDCDEQGWTDVEVNVIARPAWPTELRDSVGGQALRGAIARSSLAHSLEGTFPNPNIRSETNLAVDQSAVAEVPTAETPFPQLSLASKLRTWFRKALGIQNIQGDLERVANAVTRQEQRSEQLLQYLERLETMLVENLNDVRSDLENLAGPLRKEHIFNHLTALEVQRSLTAIQDELRLQSTISKRFDPDDEAAKNRNVNSWSLNNATQTRDLG